MRNSVAALAAFCLLAACEGNPLVVDDTTTPTTPPTEPEEEEVETNDAGIPLALANELDSVEVSADGQVLRVTIRGLDGTPEAADYAFDPDATNGLPPGYLAYTLQEDPLDRFFAGVVKESTDGSTRAAAVSDGGQFNRFIWGANYERDGSFEPPELGDGPGEGQVTYAGQYVGLDNYSGPYPPQNTDPVVQPQAPGRVTGDVLLNANFADMLVNGAIFNRDTIDDNTDDELLDLVLIVTDIDENGEFLGDLEYGNGDPATGNYGGIVGGVDAASMAGVAAFIPRPELPESWETGIFVLTQCGMAGDDDVLCNEARP